MTKNAKHVDPIAHAQNALKAAASKDTPIPAVQLPESVDGVNLVPVHLVEAARDAWKQAHDTYYRKGGIADLKAELETLNKGDTSVGNLLLKVAKACMIHAGNDTKKALPLFKGACMVTETEARQASAEENGGKQETVQKLLPTWAPAKSIVVQGFQKGLALMDEDTNGNERYPTITAVREQVARMRKAEKDGQGNGQGNSAESGVLNLFKSDRLKTALAGMFKQLIVLDEQSQDAASDIVMQTIDLLKDIRPSTEETKAINQAVAHATTHAKARTRRKAEQRAAA